VNPSEECAVLTATPPRSIGAVHFCLSALLSTLAMEHGQVKLGHRASPIPPISPPNRNCSRDRRPVRQGPGRRSAAAAFPRSAPTLAKPTGILRSKTPLFAAPPSSTLSRPRDSLPRLPSANLHPACLRPSLVLAYPAHLSTESLPQISQPNFSSLSHLSLRLLPLLPLSSEPLAVAAGLLGGWQRVHRR
jgi:hypothetical protein